MTGRYQRAVGNSRARELHEKREWRLKDSPTQYSSLPFSNLFVFPAKAARVALPFVEAHRFRRVLLPHVMMGTAAASAQAVAMDQIHGIVTSARWERTQVKVPRAVQPAPLGSFLAQELRRALDVPQGITFLRLTTNAVPAPMAHILLQA